MNTSSKRDSRKEYEALGRAAAANVAPSGPDARLGHPSTTYRKIRPPDDGACYVRQQHCARSQYLQLHILQPRKVMGKEYDGFTISITVSVSILFNELIAC